jgi:copper chaperone CopZ
MIYHNVKLAAPLDAAGAAAVKVSLRAIAGIREVGASAGESEVAIGFDGGHTSLQEIATALARAGFQLREAPKANAGCCGGCGGAH